MDRVLSFREPGGCGQAVYIRKRLCISIVFVVGFISIFGGYILGRLSMKNEYMLKTYRDMNSDVSNFIESVGNVTEVIETVISLSEHLEDTTQHYNEIVRISNEACMKEIGYNYVNKSEGVGRIIRKSLQKQFNTFQQFAYNLKLYLQKQL